MSNSLARVSALLQWVACLAAPLRGEDWPQWRGPDRTGHVPSGAPVPRVLRTQPETVWQIKIGEGLASPVVARDKLFYFDNQAGKETLHALNASDGSELWRAPVDDTFTDEQ